MADTEISETSKLEAKIFARTHSLDRRSEYKLALLLEKTWQDGARCERTMQFLERDIVPDVKLANNQQ